MNHTVKFEKIRLPFFQKKRILQVGCNKNLQMFVPALKEYSQLSGASNFKS